LFVQHKQGSFISSADWKLDPLELASKFNSKTKMIIVNNPNNPLGKVSRWTLNTISVVQGKSSLSGYHNNGETISCFH